MSNVCCKEFSGWFRSFTKVERALAVLEAILLVVLIVILILLILHLIVCSNSEELTIIILPDDITTNSTTTPNDILPYSNQTASNINESEPGTVLPTQPTNSESSDIKCSWTPSAKTTATVNYYENGSIVKSFPLHTTQVSKSKPNASLNAATDMAHASSNVTANVVELDMSSTTQRLDYLQDLIQADQSDGEIANEELGSHIVALVKLKPPEEVIFGCILTIISNYWTLTAASCIEAIEEVESLDSFVIMDQYGSNQRGSIQLVEDVQIHPLYEGKNKSYDLAAIKSGGSLTNSKKTAIKLASELDYALMNIGQRFSILGYGPYRSAEGSGSGADRRLREARVWRVARRQCGPPALRHLARGGARGGAAAAGERGGAVCGAALWARGQPPCQYCAGAPLVVGGAGAGGALAALMADNAQCGATCEPHLYANVAAQAHWVGALVAGQYTPLD